MTDRVATLFRAGKRKKNETIAERIEELLREKQLRPGDRLPSERELVTAFGVALATIRRALAVLESRGLVRRLPKRGTFYAGTATGDPPEAARQTVSPLGHAPIASIFTRITRTLTVWTKELADPSCRELWEDLAAEVSGLMSGTRIRLPETPAGLSLADGVRALAPDLFLGAERELKEVEAAGLVMPVSTAGAVPWFQPEDYFPCTHVAVLRDGKPYAIPYYISAGMKLWNDELLAATGQPLPARSTAAALTPLMQALRQRELPSLAATFIHSPLYQWFEDGIVSWDPALGTLTLDRAAAAASLEFNRDMFQRLPGLLVPAAEGGLMFRPQAVWDAFVAGKVLVMDTFSYALGHLSRLPPFPMRVQAPPPFPGRAVAALTSMFVLSPTCIERERALEFMRIASGPEGQALLARSLHNIPVRRAVARSAEYQGRCPAGMAGLLKTLDSPRSVFHECPIVNHSPLELKALDAGIACYHGERSVDETLVTLEAVLRQMGQSRLGPA